MSVDNHQIVPSKAHELFETYAVPVLNFIGDLAQKASTLALRILAGVCVVGGLAVIANHLQLFPAAFAFLIAPQIIIPVIALSCSIAVGFALADKITSIIEMRKNEKA